MAIDPIILVNNFITLAENQTVQLNGDKVIAKMPGKESWDSIVVKEFNVAIATLKSKKFTHQELDKLDGAIHTINDQMSKIKKPIGFKEASTQLKRELHLKFFEDQLDFLNNRLNLLKAGNEKFNEEFASFPKDEKKRMVEERNKIIEDIKAEIKGINTSLLMKQDEGSKTLYIKSMRILEGLNKIEENVPELMETPVIDKGAERFIEEFSITPQEKKLHSVMTLLQTQYQAISEQAKGLNLTSHEIRAILNRINRLNENLNNLESRVKETIPRYLDKSTKERLTKDLDSILEIRGNLKKMTPKLTRHEQSALVKEGIIVKEKTKKPTRKEVLKQRRATRERALKKFKEAGKKIITGQKVVGKIEELKKDRAEALGKFRKAGKEVIKGQRKERAEAAHAERMKILEQLDAIITDFNTHNDDLTRDVKELSTLIKKRKTPQMVILQNIESLSQRNALLTEIIEDFRSKAEGTLTENEIAKELDPIIHLQQMRTEKLERYSRMASKQQMASGKTFADIVSRSPEKSIANQQLQKLIEDHKTLDRDALNLLQNHDLSTGMKEAQIGLLLERETKLNSDFHRYLEKAKQAKMKENPRLEDIRNRQHERIQQLEAAIEEAPFVGRASEMDFVGAVQKNLPKPEISRPVEAPKQPPVSPEERNVRIEQSLLKENSQLIKEFKRQHRFTPGSLADAGRKERLLRSLIEREESLLMAIDSQFPDKRQLVESFSQIVERDKKPLLKVHGEVNKRLDALKRSLDEIVNRREKDIQSADRLLTGRLSTFFETDPSEIGQEEWEDTLRDLIDKEKEILRYANEYLEQKGLSIKSFAAAASEIETPIEEIQKRHTRNLRQLKSSLGLTEL